MTFDLAIKDGIVVDGTGKPSRRADIGVRAGRIVAIAPQGRLEEPAAKTLQADGLVVAPGFIDVHAHLDAQVFWDPTCSPSLQHGVTTSVLGNCGYSLAPLTSDEDADYVMRMFSNVEEIPEATLLAGAPWDWRSFDEYLARVQAVGPVINLGFLVGHSALRRAVMGADAVGGQPSTDQLAQMQRLLADCLAAGGLGFSSSWQTTARDGDGQPVPSRWASADEIVSLCSVLSRAPGTSVEFIPQLDAQPYFDSDRVDLLIRMSRAAGRTLNWNIFHAWAEERRMVDSQLGASDAAARAGARVVALMYPGIVKTRRTFLSSQGYADLPGWAPIMRLSHAEKLRLLADPDQRARLAVMGRTPLPDGTRHRLSFFEQLEVREVQTEATRRYEGRIIGDIATDEDRDPFDVLCDIAVANDLRAGFLTRLDGRKGEDPASWELRIESWKNPDVILGASDTGAHLTTLETFDWATEFLHLNRERQALSLEQAINRITDSQARLFGMVDRGRIEEGFRADLVVFDPAEIGPERARWRADLPAGAGRLFGVARGLANVVVNGVEVLRDAIPTGDQPGLVLRSGVDTVTVPLPA